MFAGYWPRVKTGKEEPFADKLNAIPKIVFSKTLDRAPWGDWDDAQIVAKSAPEEVAKLRRRKGKDMVIWGSISLAQSLMNEGLIDEYQLIICPVVLGEGRPLFGEDVDSLNMKLLRTKSFDRGAVLMAYKAEARRR